MSSSISKMLQQLQGVKEYLTRYRDSRMVYESKLAEIVKKGPRSQRQPKQSAVADAIEAWKLAARKNAYSTIPKRTIRTLCCVSEIATTNEFIDLLRTSQDLVSPRMVRDLLGIYFAQWTERNRKIHFESFLAEVLTSYEGTSKLMLSWKATINCILGDNAPRNVAVRLALTLDTVNSFFEALQLPRQHAKFSNAVALQLAGLLSSKLGATDSPNIEIWNYFKDYLLKAALLHKEQLDVVLANLITAVDTHRGKSAWYPVLEFLRDFILTHPELGDPRIETLKWNNFNEEAKLIFISWLAEEDITLFFELIIKNDPHQRKPYWLRYVRSARNSTVIIGEADFKYHNEDLVAFRKEGRSFSRGFGIPSSAFVLDFGKVAIVEFSEVNNACYIYDRKDLPGLFKTTAGGWKDLRGLKDKNKATNIQTHHRNWQGSLDSIMLTHGVAPICYAAGMKSAWQQAPIK